MNELLDKAMDILCRMKDDHDDYEEGRCKLFVRWDEYVEEINDLITAVDRAREEQANLAVIGLEKEKAKGIDQ